VAGAAGDLKRDNHTLSRDDRVDTFSNLFHFCNDLVPKGKGATKRSFTPQDRCVQVAGSHCQRLHKRLKRGCDTR
jgi:hypothetical protein